MRTLLVAFLVLAAVPFGAVRTAAAAPIRIVAAENFYGELAREIAGPTADITSILSKPDEDPHLFEVTPSTARMLSETDILVYNGAGYDPWMDKLAAVSQSDGRTSLIAARLVGAVPGENPHLWYAPTTFPAVAEALAAELSRRDPVNADRYNANLKAFENGFDRVQQKVKALRKKFSGTPVTATEPVFGYMIAALGLIDENEAFQTAMMNDTEPTPKQVARFEKSLRKRDVRILFYNSQVTDEGTRHLLDMAKSSQVAVVGVTETMPSDTTIASWFDGQIAAVRKALEATQ